MPKLAATTDPRTAVYLRISLDQTGEGLAIDRQREDCVAIAADREWTVTRTYTDTVSATKRTVKRPGYNQMEADYLAGEFTNIVCYDIDRLSRQPAQLEAWIERAETRGLILVTANGEADLATDGGRLFLRIKAAVARSEVERKSARQKRAAQQRAESGKPPLGVRLTGYTPAGEVIPAEAVIVQRIYSEFADGVPLAQIAARLNEDGIPARGAPAGTTAQREARAVRGDTGTWRPSTIRSILTNVRYTGEAIYMGQALGTRGIWEPLIEESAFIEIQMTLADPRRRTNPGGVNRKHLGSGLFRCAICGDGVTIRGSSYWCARGGHVQRALTHVDGYVTAIVADRLRAPDVAAAFLTTDSAAEKLGARQIETLRQRLAQTDADYDADLIDARRHREKTAKLTAELQTIQLARARSVAGGRLEAILGADDPGDAFEQASLTARRIVIEFLGEVRLHRGVKGSKVFRPESIDIVWHREAVPPLIAL